MVGCAILTAMPVDAYFQHGAGGRFIPTDYARGPWDPDACHAGPPTGLMARASELLVTDKPLVRLLVELARPIPMSGFEVSAAIERNGRAVATTAIDVHDEDRSYARAFGLHVAEADVSVSTHHVEFPPLASAVEGAFPIDVTHDLVGFDQSVRVRYAPELSQGAGGETFMWAEAKVPLLAGEQPSGFQRLCPLADCGNGISWHEGTDRMAFMNADLVVAVHRQPIGTWMASHSTSFWEQSGIGRADALLFDEDGPVGRAMQNLVLRRAGTAR